MFALVVTWSITGTYRVANKNVTMHGYQVKLLLLIIARASGDASLDALEDLVKSIFFFKKSMFFRPMNSFFLLN